MTCHNRLIRIALFCLLITLTACVEMKQSISVHKSGRGEFSIFLSVPQNAYKDLVQNDPQLARFFDPQLGSAWFNEADGIKITKYRVHGLDDDRKYVNIEGMISDVEKALASGKLGAFRLQKDGKKRRIQLALKAPEKSDDSIRKLAKGVKLELAIEVPGKILKTSASKNRNGTVHWFFNADSDHEFLQSPPEIFVEYQ